MTKKNVTLKQNNVPQISLGDTFLLKRDSRYPLPCSAMDRTVRQGDRWKTVRTGKGVSSNCSSLFQDVFPEIFQLLSDLAKEAF